jgi:hypothetical protein
MAGSGHSVWSAADWRMAAERLAECSRELADVDLRREFEEMAADALRTADEIEGLGGYSRGLDPLTELMTRHPERH